nr:non-ribosomal peptide synthetase [Desulfoluna spongiiphila]
MLSDIHDVSGRENLISLGLDSLTMMRLLSRWRRAGAGITFSGMVEEPTLDAWWRLVCDSNGFADKGSSSSHWAPPGSSSTSPPFPLTGVQYAYWLGRKKDQSLGGVGCHAYLEFDGAEVCPQRLTRAWQSLMAFHPMLGALFLENGTQQLAPAANAAPLMVRDLSALSDKEVAETLYRVRTQLSHRLLSVEEGECAGLSLSLLPEGQTRIHFDLDLLVADVESLRILLKDLYRFYSGEKRGPGRGTWRFDRYLEEEEHRRKGEREKAKMYWRARLPDLPGAPGLPLRVRPEALDTVVFRRRVCRLSPERWQLLKKRAARYQATPAMALLTAYGEVLDRWSRHSRFLVNIPLFDRQPDYEGIDEVVADFTTLMLHEVDLSGGGSFAVRLEGTRERFQKDLAHASWSGLEVQREKARMTGRNDNLAPVVFSCNLGAPLVDSAFESCLGRMGYMVSQTPQVWLDFQVYERDGGLDLCWDSVDDLFPENMVADMFKGFEGLMACLTEAAGRWDAEGQEPFACPVPEPCHPSVPVLPALLHDGFFDHAGRSPQHVALVDSDTGRQVTYAELARDALRVAALLVQRGVVPGQRVAISLPRGKDQVVAVLGVLAAGAAYVPMGPDQPPARRAVMAQKAEVVLCIADRAGVGALSSIPSTEIGEAAFMAPLQAPVSVLPEAVAYIIFTSGSTGEPKGVAVSHRAAFNTIAAVNQRYKVGEGDVVLALSSLDFDLSVYDLFGTFFAGGSLVTVPHGARRDAGVWLTLCEAHGVTLWNSVPILFEMLLVAAEAKPGILKGLRQVILSGDWIGLDLPERTRRVFPQCRMAAMGGATEASIWSNVHDITLPLSPRWPSIPYGKSLDNQLFRVVDDKGRDRPLWVEGELMIGGHGLAEGYTGDDALTRERFVTRKEGRWYRTGDLGRLRPCGNLEFLGRRDFQLKIRGHRIEPGEVETAITKFPGVQQAVVMANEGATGLEAAIQVPVAEGDTGMVVQGLQRFLSERLPDHMVPAVVVPFSTFPLNRNGKLDRSLLKAKVREAHASGRAAGKALSGALERAIGEIWARVLGLERLFRDDNFFLCGGDSLKATRIVECLVSEGHAPDGISLGVFFKHPTVAGLAEQIRVNRKDRDAAEADFECGTL